jgi:hypothetical protein
MDEHYEKGAPKAAGFMYEGRALRDGGVRSPIGVEQPPRSSGADPNRPTSSV